jgi:hypothetical protein
MNTKEKIDMYHFSDEISALSRDFYHQLQDEIPEGTELEFTLEEWIPLFIEFVQKRMNDGKEDGITATSPEFKKILENAPPWDGSLPRHWR